MSEEKVVRLVPKAVPPSQYDLNGTIDDVKDFFSRHAEKGTGMVIILRTVPEEGKMGRVFYQSNMADVEVLTQITLSQHDYQEFVRGE